MSFFWGGGGGEREVRQALSYADVTLRTWNKNDRQKRKKKKKKKNNNQYK